MSEFRIISHNYAFDSTVDILPSSEDTNFPASNLADYGVGNVWRSNPDGGTFVITSSNKYINFKESGGGAELTATLTEDTYTADELESAIKAAMEVPGAETYTVTYDPDTGLWTIATAGAYLSVLWLTGTNTANSIGASLGFDVSADDSGALTYTGSGIAIHTEEAVVFDCMVDTRVDSVMVLFEKRIGSKLTTNAVVKFEGSHTNAWVTPVFSTTLTFDETYEGFSHFYAAASYNECRYYRLKIVDPSNPDLYVEIPKIVFGTATQLTQVPQLGFALKTTDLSNSERTPYGHRYTDIYPQMDTFDFKYAALTSADLATLEAIYARVGSAAPVVLSLDSTATVYDKDRFLIYGYLKQDFSREHVFYTFFNTSLVLEGAL